jgi:transposase
MRPAKAFPKGATEKLRVALQQAKTKSNFQRVQCLWLRAALGLDANQVAIAIGWQPTSVRRLQARYLHEGEDILSTVGRGGRRHQNLAEEEEAQLLSQFTTRAERGGMLEVS